MALPDRQEAAGLGQPPAQGADDRRRLQDPAVGVRRHLDLQDPLPRGPEAADAAPHGRWLPPLQPGRRRKAAHDPAPAARRVPAAAGDPPGARGRRRDRPRRGDGGERRPSGGGVRRAILVNTSSAYLTLDELIEETGAREELIAELENYGIVQSEKREGKTVYDETDREVVRAANELARFGVGARNMRVFRTSADRESNLLEALLGSVAALAQPGPAQGSAGEPREPGGDGQPPQAPAAGQGPAPAGGQLGRASRDDAEGHPPTHDPGPARRGLGAGLRPLQPAALVAADEPGRERRAQAATGGGRMDQGPRDLRGPRRERRLPLPQLGRARALRLGAAASRERPSSAT